MTGQGGGDSHQVVGQLSHKVYFVDLALSHITMNVSSDLGETWTTDDASGTIGALLDDRQWVEADEAYPATTAQGGNVYISAINLEDAAFPTLIALRSTHGAAPLSFNSDSTCNTGTYAIGANPLPALTALRMATLGGAFALGLDREIGSLAIGKQADAVAVDVSSIDELPMYDPVSHLVHVAGREHVTDVWIAGERVVDGRRLKLDPPEDC